MAESRPGRGQPDRAEPEVVLRILRIAASTEHHVRTLARRYAGMFTHWEKGRSHYCPGQETCTRHRLDRIWKGYTPVEVWDQAGALWIPWVLEITEGLELDLRGRWDRGQVWCLNRGPLAKKGKAPPVRGRLLEERPEATFPPEFDMRGVLYHTFHTQGIRLDQDNPLPPRMILKASAGAPPVDPAKEKKDDTPTSGADVRRLLHEAQKRMSMPDLENKNKDNGVR